MAGIVELGMQELLDLAASKTWWVWTIGVCPETSGPVLSASSFLLGDTPREVLFALPLLLALDELRADLFVAELNRAGGWDEAIRAMQEQRLGALRAALPVPTVSYVGSA